MIGNFQLLLLATILFGAANTEILIASDVQICAKLCSGCGGTSTFDNQVCDCSVTDKDEKGSECLKHLIKGQTENLNLGSVFTNQENTNRGARCSSLFRSRKGMGKGDFDRVANYFVSGGPLTGMPFLGSPTPKCDESPEVARNSLENSADRVAAKNIDTPVIESSSAPKADESSESFDTMPVSSSQYDNSIVGSPHNLRSRGLTHGRQGLLRGIPNLLLGIPQALIGQANPGYVGMNYPPYLGATQRSNIIGGSQYPHLLGAVAPGNRGILRNIDETVATYVPGNFYGNMVGLPQNQIISPYVGIPNPMMTGVQMPAYYPGFSGATHYSPMMQPVATRIGEPNIDNTRMMNEKKQSQSENLEISEQSKKFDEEPIMLRQALAQQNQILESLSQQLRNYAPNVGAPNYQYTPMHYNMLGAPNPMQKCNCNEQFLAINGYPNNVGSAMSYRDEKPSMGAAEETRQTDDLKISAIPPRAMFEENKASGSDDKYQRNSHESTMKKEECDWKCLPKDLTKPARDAYTFNRMKRGSVKGIEKIGSIVSELETL